MDDATEIMDENKSKALYENLPPSKFIAPKMPFNSSFLKGDLDNVILMALRKEPARRYASVEDLSKDISNYLDGLPVSARPNTFWYRSSKFFSRNKTASIVGILLIISLILGIITTAWQAVIAGRERDLAQQRFNDVRRLSNSLLFEITPKIERLQGSTEAREILVKRALEYLDSLAAVSQNDLSLQSELASAYEKVGELQGNSSRPNLGNFTGAKESLLKANRIRQNLPKSVENLSLLAENYRILADILFEQNETEAALQDNFEAIKIYQELVDQNPDSENLRIAYTKTLIDLGQLYQFTWKLDKSIEVSNQVKKETEKLDQNKKETQEIVATNLTDLGYSLSWNNQQKEAEIEMAKAVEIVESLAAKFPNDARTQRIVWRTFTQASAIYETIKDDISLRFAEKALESAIIAVQKDLTDFQAKHNLARAYYRKATCFNNLNKLSDALASLKTAQELLKELIEREPKNKVYQVEMARIYTNSGEIKFKQNNLEQALSSFQEAANIREKILQSDAKNTNASRDLAVDFRNIGDISSKLGSKDKAKIHYEKSLEIIIELKNNNTLSEIDNKLIEEIKNKLAKL